MSAADTVPLADAAAEGPARAPLFGLRVSGLGAAVPETRVSNDDLARRLDTSDAWIHERTGIRARRVATGAESTTSLACAAGRRALADAGVAPADVDLVLVATSTADSPCPSTASRVAAGLGLRAGGFDVDGACTGFVHALHAAAALLADPSIRCALVIGAERYTTLIDPDDRATAVLFGDGAGAAVVTRAERRPGAPGILATDLGGDAGAVAVVEVPRGQPYLAMDGAELFRRATRGLVASGRAVLERASATSEDVDLYVPHQANRRIVGAAAARLGISEDRVAFDMAERANTSAASIPLALDAAWRAGALEPGMGVLISGIGAGLAWSSLYLRWGR
ncbi:beta-ketoacyl-ACP synthase 3 [Aquihabitans daechungensis]|uniref:beta-ketoacyl-ACP synthase 3 n=1 Tax=Aquihabitans daechungensis TaxID=1052257 RepID=UPI003B9FCC24